MKQKHTLEVDLRCEVNNKLSYVFIHIMYDHSHKSTSERHYVREMEGNSQMI